LLRVRVLRVCLSCETSDGPVRQAGENSDKKTRLIESDPFAALLDEERDRIASPALTDVLLLFGVYRACHCNFRNSGVPVFLRREPFRYVAPAAC
jgi:hypothetical protein